MTTGWIHPPEMERHRQRDRFDAILEGDRYGLSRELSLAIWERVCADATDHAGRCDTEQAKRRFHEIAARLAARGGRSRPDVGRRTRVETETSGARADAWRQSELSPRIPGRRTLVDIEAQRSIVQDQPVTAPEGTEVAQDQLVAAIEGADAATSTSQQFGADEAMQAVSSHSDRPLDLRAWAPPVRQPAAPEQQSAFAERRDLVQHAARSGREVAASLAMGGAADAVPA